MSIKIMAWNVRGLCNPSKRVIVKRLLRKWKIEIVVLVETKMECWDDFGVSQVWWSRNFGWLELPAIGSSGGILIIWDKGVLELEDFCCGFHSLSLVCKSLQDNFRWVLSGVYGPCGVGSSRVLWNELENVRTRWNLPWCVGGDFNVVRFSTERRGGCPITRDMVRFSSFVERCSLIDLDLVGAQFTFSNGHSVPSMSRIDRFLISPEWEAHFSSVIQRALHVAASDHLPILLYPQDESWGPTPFRFELMWFKDPSLDELLRNWWSDFRFEGNAGFVLFSKLRALKKKLKEWNEISFGRVDLKLDSLLAVISSINLEEEISTLDEDTRRKRNEAKEEFERLSLLQEISWRQKARVRNLREGDRNTAYFHRVANARKRRNSLSHLLVDGVRVETKEGMCEAVVDFYDKLYDSNLPTRPVLDDMHFESIDEEASNLLDASLSGEEIEEALKALGRDRAPGPDGFPIEFFIHCWDFVKEDVMRVVEDFNERSFIDWRLNATFISLIPKKDLVVEVKDFRPISLMGSVYKIITKALAERLKPFLPSLITAAQGTFVKGRHILDGVLVANELIDSRLRSGIPGVLCKVDLEKAYDHVDWNFLDYVLRRMGFGTRWRSWVRTCISTVSFSVLVNGSPKGFFRSKRGIRQGDPLSPFLFLLVMEPLNYMLVRAKELGWISGFKASSLGTSVSHLHFADDTLVFLDATEAQVANLRFILVCFELVSGLHANLAKSKLLSVGVVSNLDLLAMVLGCGLEFLPTSYLGLPLGAKYFSEALWNPVVDRYSKKLALWKCPLLSYGGKLVLVKSVLSSLPLYFLSLFSMPMTVVHVIERIIRNFLWDGASGKTRNHLVRWDIVVQSKDVGGLGIRSLHDVNIALLGKWLWRYGVELDALWRKVIIEKYGTGRTTFEPKFPKLTYGTSVWRGICNSWPEFANGIEFQIGNGEMVRFWEDRWIGDKFMDRFPLLYASSRSKNSWIKDVFVSNSSGGGGNWELGLPRRLPDVAIQQFASIMGLVANVQLGNDGVEDTRLWRWDVNGGFSVSSFYNHLAGHRLATFPTKYVWSTTIPTKTSFFLWVAMHEKISTIDNLQRRRWKFANRCYLCKSEAETTNHLLIHCPIASYIWSFFFCNLGLTFTLPATFKGLIESWSTVGLLGRRLEIAKVLPAAVAWTLWLERNQRAFEDKEKDHHKIITDVIYLIFGWCYAAGKLGTIRLDELIVNWSGVIFDPG